MGKIREILSRPRRWIGSGAIPAAGVAAALVATAIGTLGVSHAKPSSCIVWEHNKPNSVGCHETVMVCGGPPRYLGGKPTCHYERKAPACQSSDRVTCEVVRP